MPTKRRRRKKIGVLFQFIQFNMLKACKIIVKLYTFNIKTKANQSTCEEKISQSVCRFEHVLKNFIIIVASFCVWKFCVLAEMAKRTKNCEYQISLYFRKMFGNFYCFVTFAEYLDLLSRCGYIL